MHVTLIRRRPMMANFRCQLDSIKEYLDKWQRIILGVSTRVIWEDRQRPLLNL
jgi:hypothetical protein